MPYLFMATMALMMAYSAYAFKRDWKNTWESFGR